MLLLDNNVFPERYRHAISPALKISCEIVTVLILLEIGMNVVWCQLERLLESTLKRAFMADGLNMYADMGGDTFTGFVISTLAFAVFLNIAIMTGWVKYLKLHILNVLQSQQIRNVVDYCKGDSCNDFKEDVLVENTMASLQPEYAGDEVLYDDEQRDFPEEPELPKPKTQQRKKVISLRCIVKED